MLVLHIGPHKTATTYIQHNLFAKRDELKTLGWCYPSVGMLDQRAHHDLAHNYSEYLNSDGKHFAELTEGVRDEAGDASIVFSAEGFCRWKPEQFRKLSELLGQTEIHLVYAVRDPVSLFYSYWAEEVKQGCPASLPQRFANNFNDPLKSRIVNSMVDLDPLLQMDDSQLHILLVEAIRRKNGDIFEVFAQSVLGLQNLKAQEKARSNQSYPIELTEFLRLLTARKANGAPHVGPELRHKFIRGTNANERQQIVSVIQTYAKHARKQITVPRDTFVMQTLEGQIRERLSGLIYPEEDAAEPFLNEAAILPYYDDHALAAQPIVAALLDYYEKKIELTELQ